MSSRAIKLTQIHALNWYGYQDSLPVQGNLVLAGVTGSGKSILMDLIMLVLVGPDRARHHFNRSATGTKSDRTLKSYCLLDTKREENGQPQYFRDKGGVTYVALEFTWPDLQRVETWGLRIEFRHATENEGQVRPFFCVGRMERDDFRETSLDGKKRPLDLGAFTEFIHSRAGRVFPSQREYLRDMANGAHLNFNREVLERLLPSAMSFTNLKSFDDFCRRFVLPGDEVAVEDVTSSYKDFLHYEKELNDLHVQETRLQQIKAWAEAKTEAERDRDVSRYLAAELRLEHARHGVSSLTTKLEERRSAHAADDARLKELEEQTDHAKNERDRLLSLLNETEEGRLYQELQRQEREKRQKVELLQGLSGRVEDRLRKRVTDAREWLRKAREADTHKALKTRPMESAIERLESCDTAGTYTALSRLREAALQLCEGLRQSVGDEVKELGRKRKEQEDLEQQISCLKHGLSPLPQPLLNAINEALPRLPGQAPAQALRDLCEVSDEVWREAVEVAFVEKFAVVVAEEHFGEALRVYQQLTPSQQSKMGASEMLLDPVRLRNSSAAAQPGSLAEKLEIRHPAARAFVNEQFGSMQCLESWGDFNQHQGDAVLRDGFFKHGSVIRRPGHYDGVPFVGKKGLQKQMEIKTTQLHDVKAVIRRLEPLEQAVQKVIVEMERHLPEHTGMAQDMTRLEELPALESELEDIRRSIQNIDTAELTSLSAQADEWRSRQQVLEGEKLEIVGRGVQREIAQLESNLANRLKDVDELEREFTQVKIQIDISLHLGRMREWRQQMQETYLASDVMAREFDKEQSRAGEKALALEGDLKLAAAQFKNLFRPKFDDFPEDGRTVKPFLDHLERIAGANIPEYKAKAAAEKKRWENLFRTQVLSRMQAALKNVENTIYLLNQQLRRPIGHDRYTIERRPNPEFSIYRELIDANALGGEDDLFFSSMRGELRDTLEKFLDTLVNKPNTADAAKLLDYRQYYDYKLLCSDVRDPEAASIDVDRQSGKSSGGENQSPYFVAILASYLHAYNRHEKRWKEPSLALVPIDEAFSKLSGERIQDCIAAVGELDLQGVFSMSSGNIPYAFSLCDELIVIAKREQRQGNKISIRNLPSILLRDTPEGKEWMDRYEG